jgi:hypothetical protein
VASGVAFPDKQHCELAYGVGNCVAGPDGTWVGNVLAPPKASPPATPPLVSFPDQQSCEVAFGAGNCIQGLYGDWFSTEAYQASGLSTLTQGTDWDPISWGKSALSDVTGVFGATERWVMKQIVTAASLIENDITKVWTWLYARFGGVENTISHLAGEINNLILKAPSYVVKGEAWLWNEVNPWIETAVSDVPGLVSTYLNDYNKWTNILDPYIQSALSVFARDVITPLRDEVKKLDPSLYNSVSSDWNQFKTHDLPKLKHDIADAQAVVHNAVYWIDHSGYDIKVLLDDCWEWLEELGKISYQAAKVSPGGLKTALPRAWTTAAAEPDTAAIDKVISWLEEELPNV